MPSCEAAVGRERKGIFVLMEAILAISMDLPPPAPMRKPASISLALASARSTSSSFDAVQMRVWGSKPPEFSSSKMVFPTTSSV